MAKRLIDIGKKVGGPAGSWRRRWAVLMSLVLAVGGGLVIVRAVHDDGLFELDGDATSGTHPTFVPPFNPPAALDDWDHVCYQVAINAGLSPSAAQAKCTTNTGAPGANAVSWVSELLPNSTIFVGGGSKDPQDINNWAWKNESGGLPDKDNLVHAYAARYHLPNPLLPNAKCPGTETTCDIIYFGSDRFDNSGDAQQAFWFLQNEIGLGTNKVGGAFGFVTGSTSTPPEFHRPGDVLIISDFSNGGTVATISVFKWDPVRPDPANPVQFTGCVATNKAVKPNDPTKTVNDTTCADANLRILANLVGDAAKCTTTGPNDIACGVVNPTTINMPWAFTDKSGTPNKGALNGEFFEAGIDLTPFNLGGECFASVVSETRSSTSTTATLKDFVLGSFAKCESGLTTTPQSVDGDISDHLSIGTGVVQARDKADLTIGGIANWSGTLTFHLCGPIATGTCDTGGTLIGGGGTITNASNNPSFSDFANISSVGRYCFRADFVSQTTGVPDAHDSRETECFIVDPVTPTLTTGASTTVVLGGAIHDTAFLSGTATKPGDPIINPTTPGGAATGTITFNLYGPIVGPITDTSCTTLAAGFTATTKSVSGNANYVSADFTPTAVGTYVWIASYDGDSPNTNASAPSLCSDAAESVTITDTTAVTSAQIWVPNDSGTVAATGGSALSGTLSLDLYESANCSGPAVTGQHYQKTLTNATTLADRTIISTNSTYSVLATITVSWKTVFTPSGSNVSGSDHCESTSLTIVN